MTDALNRVTETPVDLRLGELSVLTPHQGDRVVVLVSDGCGDLWVRAVQPTDEKSQMLDVTATGTVLTSETPAEAAYRILYEMMGFRTPLDEAITNRTVSLEPRRATHVFIGHLDHMPPSSEGTPFVSRSLSELRALVRTNPEMFTPSFQDDLELGQTAQEARDAEVTAAVNRHPASSWRDRPRVQRAGAVPDSVDLRINGLCQLRCPWCWGPEHHRPGTVSRHQWEAVIGALAKIGTTQIILSGGEPTLSKALRPCVIAAKHYGMSVTLSTNGIKLAKFTDVLEHVDDLGIPLDGSTPETNEQMRTRSEKHEAWQQALSAMRLIQEMHRNGHSKAILTVRTVIARPNLDDVPAIPAALTANGVNLGSLRLKLYQVEPFGPHFSDTDFDRDWAVTEDEARDAFDTIRVLHPDLHVDLQLYAGTVGRYFLVDPDGEATGTDELPDGTPIEVPYGNLVNDFSGSIEAFQRHQRQIASQHHLPQGHG